MGLLHFITAFSIFKFYFRGQGQRWFCGLSYAMYGSITFDKLGSRIIGYHRILKWSKDPVVLNGSDTLSLRRGVFLAPDCSEFRRVSVYISVYLFHSCTGVLLSVSFQTNFAQEDAIACT